MDSRDRIIAELRELVAKQAAQLPPATRPQIGSDVERWPFADWLLEKEATGCPRRRRCSEKEGVPGHEFF